MYKINLIWPSVWRLLTGPVGAYCSKQSLIKSELWQYFLFILFILNLAWHCGQLNSVHFNVIAAQSIPSQKGLLRRLNLSPPHPIQPKDAQCQIVFHREGVWFRLFTDTKNSPWCFSSQWWWFDSKHSQLGRDTESTDRKQRHDEDSSACVKGWSHTPTQLQVWGKLGRGVGLKDTLPQDLPSVHVIKENLRNDNGDPEDNS